MDRKKTIGIIVNGAIYGALVIILYCVPGLQFSLPFAPSFLKLHFEEIPIFIAGFASDPVVAIIIIVIKSLIKLITDIPETGGIGVLIDFVYSMAFVLPACYYYKYHKTIMGALVSLLIGMASNLVMSCVIGLYVFYPLYGFYFYGASSYSEAMINIGRIFATIDPSIKSATDPKIIYEFLLPFNIIKDAIVVAAVFGLYKPLKKLLERISGYGGTTKKEDEEVIENSNIENVEENDNKSNINAEEKNEIAK